MRPLLLAATLFTLASTPAPGAAQEYDPQDEIPEPSWLITRDFEVLLAKLQGCWRLTGYFATDTRVAGRQEVAYMLVSREFMTLELHMGFFTSSREVETLTDSFFQSGTYRMAADPRGRLVLQTLIGAAFDPAERVIFEPPGTRRVFLTEIRANSLILTRYPDQTRFTFERVPSVLQEDFFGRPIPKDPDAPPPPEAPPLPEQEETPWYRPDASRPRPSFRNTDELRVLLAKMQGAWQLVEFFAPLSEVTGRQEVAFLNVTEDFLSIEFHMGYFAEGRFSEQLVESYFQTGTYRVSTNDNGALVLTTLIGSGFDAYERLIFEPPGTVRAFVAEVRRDQLILTRPADGTRYVFEPVLSQLKRDFYGRVIEEGEPEAGVEGEAEEPEADGGEDGERAGG